MPRIRKRATIQVVFLVITCGLVCLLVEFGVNRPGDESETNFSREELLNLLSEAALENSQRISTVRKTCEKYNLGIYKKSDDAGIFKHPPAPQYSVFYIDAIHNLSYCPVYKAGSTTWLYNLCLLLNVSEERLLNGKEQISTIARRVIPELEFPKAKEELDKSVKLLVVRHPFERLLSAYRDKLENSVAGREHGTLHFYRKYGSAIVRKYRGKDQPAPRDDQVIREEGSLGPAGIEPTWREFVEYLIDTDLASYGDDHWMPYYLFCTPCLVDYDYIAKVETLRRDQIFTIRELGLTGKIKPRWRHSNGRRSDAARIYFSQLNEKTVRRLFGKFRLDFELFGYSPEEYYGYATSPTR